MIKKTKSTVYIKATIPGWYLWVFFNSPVGAIPFLNILWERCFLGCFPPFTGAFRMSFHGSWMSLPIAATSQCICGFLGVYFICTISTISRCK